MVGEWDGPSWFIFWGLPQYIFLVGYITLIYTNVVYIYIILMYTYYLYSLVVSTTLQQTWLAGNHRTKRAIFQHAVLTAEPLGGLGSTH